MKTLRHFRSFTALRFGALLVSTVVGVAVLGATVARADDPAADDQSQLLDVSKQVNGIQNKLNQLISHGQSAKTGKMSSSADCGYGDPSPVFSSWGDGATYTLAPQGDFSATDEWTLGKQATVTPSADPFSGSQQSLQFGNGAQVATPVMCVGLDNPSIRFFTRDVGGNGKSDLKVDVLYEDLTGKVKHLTIARLKAGSDWQPSVIVPMYMNMLAAASPSGITPVAFQFKAEGLQKNELLYISALYVDPWRSS